MTGARGIVAAAAIAIAVTGAHAAYRSWPVTHGTEIVVPATLVRLPFEPRLSGVQLPFARIALDVPHPSPVDGGPFEPVPRLGAWWKPAGADTRANARRLRGRPLYLQLAQGPPLWTGGPVEMRPVTISDALVDGAVNLAGLVTSVRESGYVWLDFSLGPIAVPGDTPKDARASAVLRVLPSGRATLAGVIVNGTRY